jgi:hypothetical protein
LETKLIENFGGKPEGKRPLGLPRRRWEDNINVDLGQVEWVGLNWNLLAQDRHKWQAVVSTVATFQPLHTGLTQ